MREVADAVILAGGRGTRMLPGSMYTPKEIMPLIDTPIINHLIWEACKAGVKRIHIVVSPHKKETLAKKLTESVDWISEARPDLPRISLEPVPEKVELSFHEQTIPGGVGDAISLVTKFIKGPFLVLLGDNLLIKNHIGANKSGPKFASSSCKKLVDYFYKNGIPCTGILEVPDEEVDKYGIVELENGLIKGIIEKPKIIDAPSNFILCGRYLLPENTGELLKLYSSSEYGELQSIALFEHLIRNEGFGAVNMNEFELYDSGDPINWLKSQIDHALRRDDLKEEILDWIGKRISEIKQ